MEERQTNYTIMEGHELPSGGQIYDTKVNPHVELRSMTARDEMKRLASSSTQFKTLADIIEGCMIEKPAIHVYDMAINDYEFLLHKLRTVTYGADYKMKVVCPHCGQAVETIADLDQLRVKPVDMAEFDSYRRFVLPVSGDTIKIRPNTPRILDMVENKTKEMNRKYKDANIDFSILVLLQTIIEEVNDAPLDPSKSENYINRLAARDMKAIINNLDKLSTCFGVDTSLVVDCPDCGGEVKTTFRFGSEFFGPTTI